MIRKYARRVVEAVLDRAVEELREFHEDRSGLRGQIDVLRSLLERERGDDDRLRTDSINPLEKPLDQARRELADALKREERRSENPSAFWRVADAEDALLETARKRGVGFERLLRDPLLYEARVFVRRQTTRGAYPTDDEIVDHLVRHCRFLRLIPEEGASSIAADAPIEQAKSILCVTAAPMCTCGHPHPSHYGPVLRCLADNGARQCPCDGYVPWHLPSFTEEIDAPTEGASTSTPFGDVNRAQDPVRLSGIQAGNALIEQIEHAKAILRVTMPMCVCGHLITLHNKDEACVGDAGDHVPCPCDSYTAQEREVATAVEEGVYTDAEDVAAAFRRAQGNIANG